MLNDIELLRCYADDRSDEAFAELVRRHLGLVYGAALRQLGGSAHRAEEVAQSVFIDLARKASPLARRTEIVGWLYTSTHHAAAMLKRTEMRRQAREQEAHAMLENDRDTAMDWDRVRPVLDDVMLELPDADRRAVLLRFFQNLKLADVGAQIGLSEDAARMRIDRALEKLRARLGRHGISSTEAALAAALVNHAAVAAPAALITKVTGAALAGGAGAAVGSGALVHIWNIMSTTKTIAGVSGVVALLALGTATYQSTAVRTLTANAAALEQQRSVLATERDDLRRRMAELTRVLAEARTSESAAKSAAEGKKSDAASGAASRFSSNLVDAVLNSPDYAAILAKLNAAKLGSTYAGFYRQMGFTPTQIEEFENLMSAQLGRGYDVRTATWLMGIAPGDPAYVATMQKHTADTTAKIGEWLQANLGPSGGPKLNDYNRLKPVAELVRSVAAESYDTPSPLTAAQGDQLSQLLAGSSRSYQRGGNVSLADIDWNAVQAQAAAFLSPAQMKAFMLVRDQRLLTQQMTLFQQKLQQQSTQGGK